MPTLQHLWIDNSIYVTPGEDFRRDFYAPAAAAMQARAKGHVASPAVVATMPIISSSAEFATGAAPSFFIRAARSCFGPPLWRLNATQLTETDPAGFAIYLRPAVDQRHAGLRIEPAFQRVASLFGPLLAIGRPINFRISSYASWGWLSAQEWQNVPEQWMEGVRWVILLVGASEVIAAEAERLVRIGLLERTTLVFPDLNSNQRVRAWEGFLNATEHLAGFAVLRNVNVNNALAVAFDAGGNVLVLCSTTDCTEAYECALGMAAAHIQGSTGGSGAGTTLLFRSPASCVATAEAGARAKEQVIRGRVRKSHTWAAIVIAFWIAILVKAWMDG